MRRKVDITDLESGIVHEQTIYSEGHIMQMMGKIGDSVHEYKWTHKLEPQFIVLSPKLEILLRDVAEAMNYRERIYVNKRPIEVYIIWGAPAIVSPTKEELEYEVI